MTVFFSHNYLITDNTALYQSWNSSDSKSSWWAERALVGNELQKWRPSGVSCSWTLEVSLAERLCCQFHARLVSNLRLSGEICGETVLDQAKISSDGQREQQQRHQRIEDEGGRVIAVKGQQHTSLTHTAARHHQQTCTEERTTTAPMKGPEKRFSKTQHLGTFYSGNVT